MPGYLSTHFIALRTYRSTLTGVFATEGLSRLGVAASNQRKHCAYSTTFPSQFSPPWPHGRDGVRDRHTNHNAPAHGRRTLCTTLVDRGSRRTCRVPLAHRPTYPGLDLGQGVRKAESVAVRTNRRWRKNGRPRGRLEEGSSRCAVDLRLCHLPTGRRVFRPVRVLTPNLQ